MAEPANEFEFRWLHEQIGSNGRMLELQAAIGLIQLSKLETWLKARERVAQRYSKFLSRFPTIAFVKPNSNERHAYYRFEFRVESDGRKMNRDKLLQELTYQGIKVFTGICPEIYRESAYRNRFSHEQRRPNAARLAETSAVMLSHPTLDEEYLLDCERAFEKVFEMAY
jgi:dTDP-4-amino-4,6-dideoxygalactose transaminase